jgi:hypothetical protein
LATGDSHKAVGHNLNATAKALRLIERALAIIDEISVAPDVGAHLDLAIQRLRDYMNSAE